MIAILLLLPFFRNLVPIFGNDHLIWMLESYIDEREVSAQVEETTAVFSSIREYLLKQSEVNSVEGVSILAVVLYFYFSGEEIQVSFDIVIF